MACVFGPWKPRKKLNRLRQFLAFGILALAILVVGESPLLYLFWVTLDGIPPAQEDDGHFVPAEMQNFAFW